MTFTPTPFATPVIAARTATQARAHAYISVSQYRFAPTSVGTQGLVPKSSQPQVDSAGSLAMVINEASQWMDTHCFHRSDGNFAADITNEQMWATVKPNQSIVLICNFKPILEVVGIALGPAPGSLQNLDANTAGLISIGEKTITLPGVFISGTTTVGNTVLFNGFPAYNGNVLAVYSYITGYPHTTLASSAVAGATSITVTPPVPGGSAFYGVYAGTALTIKDDANTETVVASAPPTGLTVSLSSPLLYNHNVPNAPDAITVTALPRDLERACIHLTNVFLKAQGMRAQMPASIGSPTPAQRQGLARAGALADYEVACKLLHPYVTTFLHG